ncbi:MAG: hypothetical protein GY820_19655 [Gammaproteobacteria bacterium]|nr:hypothetical protein [Gammaproteobacteria bacterium]
MHQKMLATEVEKRVPVVLTSPETEVASVGELADKAKEFVDDDKLKKERFEEELRWLEAHHRETGEVTPQSRELGIILRKLCAKAEAQTPKTEVKDVETMSKPKTEVAGEDEMQNSKTEV